MTLSDTDLIQYSVAIIFLMKVNKHVYGIVIIKNTCWEDQTIKIVKTVTYQEFRNHIDDLEEIIETLQMQIESLHNINAKS